MKNYHKVLIGFICVFFVGLGAVSMTVASEELNIKGTINDDGQLVDESGQVYEIADDGVGAEAMEYSGEKMAVKGTVAEEEGMKVIVIKSFELLAGAND
jgi:hypothetical protein